MQDLEVIRPALEDVYLAMIAKPNHEAEPGAAA